MDINKLTKLRELHYQILPTCGMCKHSSFRRDSDFGTCNQYTYQHLKHSDSKRQLSIYRAGHCDGWMRNEDELLPLNTWKEFIK